MCTKRRRTRLCKWNELILPVAIILLSVTQLILVNKVQSQKNEIEALRIEVDSLMEYPQAGMPYTTPKRNGTIHSELPPFKPSESDTTQEVQPYEPKGGTPVNQPLVRKVVHGNVSSVKIVSRDWPSVTQTIEDGDGYRKVQLDSLRSKLVEVGAKRDTAYRFLIAYTFFGPDGNVIQMTAQFQATTTELSTAEVVINPTDGILEVITN